MKSSGLALGSASLAMAITLFAAMCSRAEGFAIMPASCTRAIIKDSGGQTRRLWESSAGKRSRRTGGAPCLMALKDIARKAKEAEVARDMEALRGADPDNAVFKILAQGEAGEMVGSGDEPEFPVSSSLRKKKGTLSVVAEYRTILKSGFIDGILAPELLCPLFRNGGASAIAVATDKTTGGCTEDHVDKIVREQQKSRGDFPGPLPVLIRDLVISEFQISRAKAQGASGVTIGMSLVGEERCRELVAFCKRLGMEAVVQGTSQAEVEAAVRAGATVISIVGKGADEAIGLHEFIPDSVVSVAHVDRRSDEGLDEVEDCWKLRDAGFHSVWVSEVLYKAGQTQVESAEAIIKAIRAKSSVKYHRPTGMSGKGEGAREYLGYLAQ